MVAEKLSTEKAENENNNLTISTKFSTDQLICKSSPEGSLRNVIPLKQQDNSDANELRNKEQTPIALYFGVLQILFGLLMAVFGVLVLVHNANLSQIGGGLWGGCLATLTGVMGVLSAAKDCCPLKTSPQRIALTAFLALSLISVAVANLVLVLAAIGIARDANNTNEYDEEQLVDPSSSLPSKYSALLSSSGLVVISACEVIAAVLSAYHCTRVLCPCFKSPSASEDRCECGNGSTIYSTASVTGGKDFLVSSWLGKQAQPLSSAQTPVYVVATKSANNTRKRQMTPIMYPPPSLLQPPLVGYPLIPAPLGGTPPPFIHTHPHMPPEKIHKKRRRYPSDRQLQQQITSNKTLSHVIEKPKAKKKKEKQQQKGITEAEVAKTYTGLDRVIAEEFIEICDSTKTTSGSDSSGCTSSDTTSREFVGEKL